MSFTATQFLFKASIPTSTTTATVGAYTVPASTRGQIMALTLTNIATSNVLTYADVSLFDGTNSYGVVRGLDQRRTHSRCLGQLRRLLRSSSPAPRLRRKRRLTRAILARSMRRTWSSATSVRQQSLCTARLAPRPRRETANGQLTQARSPLPTVTT